MSALILTHLGDSVPSYIQDCVHQFRLWNPETPIYIILERLHDGNDFWSSIACKYNTQYVYTDSLIPTNHHLEFQTEYKGDVSFRKGFWKYVRERFFYIEECMIQKNLSQIISMEYDVLVYGSFEKLHAILQTLPQTLRMVRDNDQRSHPAFLYIPTIASISTFNVFLANINLLSCEDMQTLYMFANMFQVNYFPVITEARNRTIANRTSSTGYIANHACNYLSQDSEQFGTLFDSAVVGQWLGGIDLRNTGFHKITHYANESALYKFNEMPFEWHKSSNNLWQPIMDDRPLFTIHLHCKALNCFLSDRKTAPQDDYDVLEVAKTLTKN